VNGLGTGSTIKRGITKILFGNKSIGITGGFLLGLGIGGYIFIHRYLMEYFASLTEEDIKRLSAEIEAGKA
jgi:hypothetical protein